MVKLRGLPLPKNFIPRISHKIFNWAIVPEKPILLTEGLLKALRITIMRYRKKHMCYIPCTLLPIAITAKPKGSRMGGGKGKVVGTCRLVRAGRVLIECQSEFPPIPFKQLQYRLGFPTRIIHIRPEDTATPNSELLYHGPQPNKVRYCLPKSPLKWMRENQPIFMAQAKKEWDNRPFKHL